MSEDLHRQTWHWEGTTASSGALDVKGETTSGWCLLRSHAAGSRARLIMCAWVLSKGLLLGAGSVGEHARPLHAPRHADGGGVPGNPRAGIAAQDTNSLDRSAAGHGRRNGLKIEEYAEDGSDCRFSSNAKDVGSDPRLTSSHTASPSK